MAEAKRAADAKTVKTCVGEVLSTHMLKEIWTANYTPALPFTLQDYAVGALLPAMMYMFRWGHRRGKGFFKGAFDRDGDSKATIEEVTTTLTGDSTAFGGWTGEAARAILGDLLLASCLENQGHKPGRRETVQRVLPTHYMASWIDLPEDIANLRFVPEMLVALLSADRPGTTPGSKLPRGTAFGVAVGPEDNLLLKLLGKGVFVGEHLRDMRADRFDEDVEVGIDQLLTIRIAKACGSAPPKISTNSEQAAIPLQLPIARRAANGLYEDLRVFVSAYGQSIPRRSLLPMLESAIGLGVTNLMLSTARLLGDWERTGKLQSADAQESWPLFVDCSGSVDNELRRLSEEACDNCLRRFTRLPVTLMSLRILGYSVRFDRKMTAEKLPEEKPDATAWINLLGDVVQERHAHSDRILDKLHEQAEKLAELLASEKQSEEAVSLLKTTAPNPAWRLAEAVSLLMGHKLQAGHHTKCLDSSLMLNEQNGLARSRRVKLRNPAAGGYKTAEVRSIVLTNTALDFLVHRHLRRGGPLEGREARSLSFKQFIERLRTRYGLYIDESPPGLSAPRELLARNRATLERRLRDLGVMVGVNDAEDMKRLRQRFAATGDNYATT